MFLDEGNIKGILLPYADSLFEDCSNKNETEERLQEILCRVYNPADEILTFRNLASYIQDGRKITL
jgi:hypothetical protein